MALLDAVLLAVAVSVAAPQAATLREELQKHGIGAAGLDDADRQITSYAVAADEEWFGIAYYRQGSSELLPDELRVRTLERKTGVWRHAVLDRKTLAGGSALRLARRPGVIYLDLHINPSAGALIVLSEDLTVRKRLDGWSSLILPDGRVVYEHSMVHFAPFHAGSAGIYDPQTESDLRLYPSTSDDSLITEPKDRNIGTIEQIAPNRLRIAVTEQDLKWLTNTQTGSEGPERRFTVVCDISGMTPACVVEPKKNGRQD